MAAAGKAKPLGVAVFGGGRMGAVHLHTASTNPQHFKVFWTIDVDLERANQMAEVAGPHCQASDDVAKAFADANVEAVIIATPTPSHVPLIEQAIASGKHIFCEKPVSLHAEEIDRIFAQAAASNLALYCAYQRRADDSFRKLKSSIDAGLIGDVQLVRSTSRDHPAPHIAFLKTSCGFFHDCACHDIDLLCWVAGERPHRVYASGHAFNPEIAAIGDYDTAVIVLDFPNGIRGICDVSRFAGYGYDQRLEAHGSLGMVQTNNPTKTSCVVSTAAGITSDTLHYSFPTRYKEAYSIELFHFHDIVRNNAKPWIVGPDCSVIARVASACEESARSHLPVELKYD